MDIHTVEMMKKTGAKRYVRYQEGAQLYSMGLHTFQNLAREANAIRKIKGVTLVNVDVLETFIERIAGMEE